MCQYFDRNIIPPLLHVEEIPVYSPIRSSRSYLNRTKESFKISIALRRFIEVIQYGRCEKCKTGTCHYHITTRISTCVQLDLKKQEILR